MCAEINGFGGARTLISAFNSITGEIIGAQTSNVQNVLGAWNQIVASLSHTIVWVNIELDDASAARGILVALGIGSAGLETQKFTSLFRLYAAATPLIQHCIVDSSLFTKNSRLSVAVANTDSVAVDNCNITVTAGALND